MRLVLRKHLVDTLQHMEMAGMSRRQIRQVIHNEGGMKKLVAKTQALLESDPKGKLFLAAADTPRQRGALIAWLWEHRAEILSFVLEIVKLFKTVA